jgi:hypothetical protein
MMFVISVSDWYYLRLAMCECIVIAFNACWGDIEDGA